jgi:hypothetical protein
MAMSAFRAMLPNADSPQPAQTLPFSNRCILLAAIPAKGEV